jgi:hypothetical protein
VDWGKKNQTHKDGSDSLGTSPVGARLRSIMDTCEMNKREARSTRGQDIRALSSIFCFL